MKDISHGKKLNLKNLILPSPGIQNEWFREEVYMFGLTPLLTSGYENMQWEYKTSSCILILIPFLGFLSFLNFPWRKSINMQC